MFSRLFDTDERGAQAAHVQLVAERDPSPTPVPPVATFGGPADVQHVAEVRAVEAAAVAALARRIKDDAWEIVDPVTGEVRLAPHDNAALLIPTATALPRFEGAPDAAAAAAPLQSRWLGPPPSG